MTTAVVFVDAMNVIGSRPDGWWRDRDGALRRLVAELQPFAAGVAAAVVVVADGHPVAGLGEGRHADVEVVYAGRRGPDAADDRIVTLVAEATVERDPQGHPGPASEGGVPSVEVVTADRELRERVRRLGAQIVGPKELWRRLGDADDG